MHPCSSNVDQLQEVIKIYLMAVGGSTTQLGGISCAVIDVLINLCDEDQTPERVAETSKRIDNISIGIVRAVYTSIIERLDELNDSSVNSHKSECAKIESEENVLPHILMLKSVLTDISIATETDFSLISKKIQEIDGVS